VGLWLILALVTVGAIVLLAAGALTLQGYFYTEPVEGLVWRAAVAGAAVGAFVSFWCLIDRRSPGKYDTLFDFATEEKKEVTEFKAIRKDRAGNETAVAYARTPGLAGQSLFKDGTGNLFKRSASDYMVVAIEIEENGEAKRFNADLDEKGNFKDTLVYKEANGRRIMQEQPLGQVVEYRRGVLVLNLLLNFGHLLLWFLMLWLVLRFQWSHALGLAAALWLLMTLMIMPLLFARTRAKPAPAPAPAALVQPAASAWNWDSSRSIRSAEGSPARIASGDAPLAVT
jgi:hypothetical protein